MTLYITRNGERIGPMSLDQARAMVQNGTAALTDLAWYEGLPSWIPLSQVPGFAVAGAVGLPGVPEPQPERPVLVWIICILFFICVPCGMISLIVNPFLQQIRPVHTEMEQKLMATQGVWNYYVPTA